MGTFGGNEEISGGRKGLVPDPDSLGADVQTGFLRQIFSGTEEKSFHGERIVICPVIDMVQGKIGMRLMIYEKSPRHNDPDREKHAGSHSTVFYQAVGTIEERGEADCQNRCLRWVPVKPND